MSQYFVIHPRNPQLRLIRQAVAWIQRGGVIVYPTDSCYALGCQIGEKQAVERIRRIRGLGESAHNFTLVCANFSALGTYAKVDNQVYRLLRSLTPGPYTFILPATREVPRRLQHPKRKTIGVRVPEHPIVQALLNELGEPIMSSTLLLPEDPFPMTEGWDIRERLDHTVDLVIDGGNCGLEPTSVLQFARDGSVEVVRQGRGDVSGLL